MKRKAIYQCLLVMGFATIIFTASSYATSLGIDDLYDSATHRTPYWQELNDINNTADDYGVYWSVDGGAYGREDIVATKTVQFQINMHKDHVGTHYADFMKLWVDWGQDYTFDVSDVVAFEMVPLSGPLGTHQVPVFPNADFVFESIEYTIPGSLLGDLAIRSRVTCSHSLVDAMDLGLGWNDQWTLSDPLAEYNAAFLPTGWLDQGEVEDWTITVTPVPEPATMLLFGTGLVGLVGSRLRKKRK